MKSRPLTSYGELQNILRNQNWKENKGFSIQMLPTFPMYSSVPGRHHNVTKWNPDFDIIIIVMLWQRCVPAGLYNIQVYIKNILPFSYMHGDKIW